MKISAKKYAQAFYEAISEVQNANELNTCIHNFILLLQQADMLAKIEDILIHFSALYNTAHNAYDGKVILAKEVDNEAMSNINKTIKDWLKADHVNLTYTTDHALIGGFKAIFPDYIIDASVKTKLKNLQHLLLS